jgi:hypothetical protein
MTIEDLIGQPDDPPTAFTDFTIWDGAKIGPERASERPEYVFGALEWNAAYKEKFFGHGVAPLTPGSHVLKRDDFNLNRIGIPKSGWF